MTDIKVLLEYIDPSRCSYQEWVNVGMALKHEGLTAHDWDAWSRADSRYKAGECFRKWESFNRNDGGDLVTGGTIYELARRGGYVSPYEGTGTELDWNSEIRDEGVIIDSGWVEATDFREPSDAEWQPDREIITYLQTLYESTENVAYVTDVYADDDRLSPKRGVWDRTAGQLIEAVRKCGGDLGQVFGDPNPMAGAWIRFNPVDGQGIKNENITTFRFALVESDKLELGKQEAIMRQLELPIAALVYSGGKSVHAIVRIDAGDYQEYKKRVDYLYQVCNKNGLIVDTQNKNPSRLSRMPGVRRNGHKQFLMGTNIGKKTWQEWFEWIEALNDDLEDPERLSDVWDDMPELSEELIHGILRKGHKMLLAGPSKAGKSFVLIELAISIAEGTKWLGLQCSKGRVLYVNLELDRASCLHRFRDVYNALRIPSTNIGNIDIWNLRGKSLPMDKLAPKLIRRAEKRNYTAVIIDPIYKVITGDENSASEMAMFCNQFDKVCTALKCAVIYCHHHSKGQQAGKKSMDRASGSGVFARDPDAMLDMSELVLTDAIIAQIEGRTRCEIDAQYLDTYVKGWRDDAGQDDLLTPGVMDKLVFNKLTKNQQAAVDAAKLTALKQLKGMTAWRIDGILREFPTPEPLSFFFRYPIHVLDDAGILKDLDVEDNPRRNGKNKMDSGKDKERKAKEAAVRAAFNTLTAESGRDYTTAERIADWIVDNPPEGIKMPKQKRQIRDTWVKYCADLSVEDDGIVKAQQLDFDSITV